MSNRRQYLRGPWELKPGKYGAPHEIRWADKSYGIAARVLTPGHSELPEALTAAESLNLAKIITAAPAMLKALWLVEIELAGWLEDERIPADVALEMSRRLVSVMECVPDHGGDHG